MKTGSSSSSQSPVRTVTKIQAVNLKKVHILDYRKSAFALIINMSLLFINKSVPDTQ